MTLLARIGVAAGQRCPSYDDSTQPKAKRKRKRPRRGQDREIAATQWDAVSSHVGKLFVTTTAVKV